MILGAVQVIVNVADLAAAKAPLIASGFTQSFAEPRLACHPAKAPLLSAPRAALAMVHLTPPDSGPAIELTSYGAPGGTAAFHRDGGALTTTTDDRAASGAFWDALNAPEGDGGLRRFAAALPAWRLALVTADGPRRAGATTVDADGCVLVTVLATDVDAELARLRRTAPLGRSTEAWSEPVDGRLLRVAMVEGPAGELVELLQIPSGR